MIISKKINLAWIVVLLSSVCFYACDDEGSEVSTDQGTKLLSFGPAGAMHGDTVIFIGQNLSTVNTVVFTDNVLIEKANFITHSNDRIEVQVPDNAEAGAVKLLTDDKDTLESKTIINFDVVYTVQSIPGEARPESNITIQGNYLNWIEEITFFKGLVVDSFVSQSQTEIVVTVPKEAKTGPLTFLGGGTDPMTMETAIDFIVTLPAVSGVSPSRVKHTENITISGTNLDLTKEIIFPGGTVITDFVSISETSLVVAVPTTAVDGSLTMVAHSLLEVQTSDAISIILPNTTGLSPDPVALEGELTITGTDLDLVQSIAFPAASNEVTTFNSQSSTEIKVTVPADATQGFLKFTTIHGVLVNVPIQMNLPGAGPTPLAYTIYNDSFENGWSNWGWAGAEDGSTEEIFDGTGSLKILLASAGGSWEGLQFGNNTALDVSAYTNLVFYLYGGPGSDGHLVMVKVNDANNNAGSTVTVVEGEWTEFSIPISEMNANGGTDNSWSMVLLQEAGNNFDGNMGGDIYVDFLGFR